MLSEFRISYLSLKQIWVTGLSRCLIPCLTFIKQYGFVVFIFLTVPYLVLIPMFRYETWLGGHDSDGTIFNGWTMVRTLIEWPHFPLSWQPDNCTYLGNPYWSFYQPLSNLMVYFLSLFMIMFDSNYVFSAMKGAVYLSFVISAFGMFLLLRTVLVDSSRMILISVFGALIYLLAPYRFIDLYSRNAYSELWVFSWMPFYLLGFYKLFFLRDIKGWLLVAIATPCLILSHLMPSVFFIIILHCSFLIFLVLKRTLKNFILQNKKIILWWFIANIIGGIFSSLYVIPAMNVVKYINGDIIGFDRVSLGNVLEHIKWCYDMLNLTNFNGPWQAGQLYLISFFVLNLVLFIKRRSNHFDFLLYLNICLVLTFILLLSKEVWEHLPPVFYNLQFSWRLFLVYSLFCSLVISLIVSEFNLKVPAIILLLAFHLYTGERFLHYGGDDRVAKYYDIESWLNVHYRKNYTTLNNYSPHSILPKTSDPVLFSFDHADQTGRIEKFSNNFLLNSRPDINILSLKRKGNAFFYEFLLDNPAFLVFKQYFYPSWELYIDSKREKNLYLTEQGFIGFEVPEGRHSVVLKSI